MFAWDFFLRYSMMEEPSYLKLYRDGRLQARMEEGVAGLASCTLCPRSCGVNRLKRGNGVLRYRKKGESCRLQRPFR